MYSEGVAGGWKEGENTLSSTLASGNVGKVRLTRCNAATHPVPKLLRADKVVVGSGPNAPKAIRNPKALIQEAIMRSSSPLIKRKLSGVTLSAASVKPRVTIVQAQRRPAWGAANGLANFNGHTTPSGPTPRTTMRSALITQPPKPALFTQRQKIKSAGTLRAPLRLTLAANGPARSSVRITGSGVSAGVLRDRRVMLPKKHSLVKRANLKSPPKGRVTHGRDKVVLRKKMTPSSRLVELFPRRKKPDDSDNSRAASNVPGSPPPSPAHGTMRYQPPRTRSPTPRARSNSPAMRRDTPPPVATATATKKDNQSRNSSRPSSSLSPSARRKNTKKHNKERRSRSRSRSRSSSSPPAGARRKRSSEDAKRSSAPRRGEDDSERARKQAEKDKQARKKEQEREAEKQRAMEKEKLRQKELQKKKEDKLKELKLAKEHEKRAREKERERKAEKEKEARERSKRRRNSVQKNKLREAEKQKGKKMSRKRARSESSSDSSDSSSSESSRDKKKKKKRSETPRKRARTPKPGYLGVCVRFLARDGIRAFPNRTRLRDILTYFKKHWHLNGEYEFKDKDPIVRLETLVNELKTRDGHIVLRMVKA
eukprot:GEMP01008264.1.p1 GENE.GEMP01008264.1~~GEMP01008264.1.p1  ORF type:complete len:597 (+),score=202.67 GEMP01008264.1:41-1831(+)